MLPSPPTSTTFSCQLSRTLIAAPVDSLGTGRPPTWLKPVCWGVTRVGVLGALPPDDAVFAIPLYLSNPKNISPCSFYPSSSSSRHNQGSGVRETNKYFINTSRHSLPPGVP